MYGRSTRELSKREVESKRWRSLSVFIQSRLGKSQIPEEGEFESTWKVTHSRSHFLSQLWHDRYAQLLLVKLAALSLLLSKTGSKIHLLKKKLKNGVRTLQLCALSLRHLQGYSRSIPSTKCIYLANFAFKSSSIGPKAWSPALTREGLVPRWTL
jgi:hypothetical protein